MPDTLTPNMYHLSGHDLHVISPTVVIDWKPAMSNQRAHQAKSWSMRSVSVLGKCFWGILTGSLVALSASCGSVRESSPPDSEPTAAGVQEITSVACASGIAGDVFANGLVGCNGAVAWANRASLCAAGYRPATAAEWMDRGGTPTHDYWTDDPLEYSGTSSACWVSYSQGNSCGSSPMRVCTSTGTDAEGNVCNWTNCAMNSSSSGYHFGGCVSNTTAGTLCVPVGGCADGSVEQVFANGVVGCAGSVTFANAWTLCAPEYYPVSQGEWEAARGTTAPTHNYWVYDDQGWIGGLAYWTGTGSGACQAYGFSDCGLSCTASPYHSCPSGVPMHVCVPSGTDPEGNTCTWTKCAGAEDPGTNEYYGGCSGTHDAYAGTLCAPLEGCKNGRVVQHFTTAGVNGTLVEFDACAGSQTQANAANLCMAGYRLATAAEWNTYRGNVAPTHNYWTSDPLRWNGTSGACWVSTTLGSSSCAIGHPMHVCTSTGTDPEGNTCAWANCGLDTTTPDAFFGGCSGTNDAYAGALCVRPMPPPG